MQDLTGKKALVMGVANERSIAYGIAQALKAQGCELGFTYIPAIEKRVRPIAESLGAKFLVECDVTNDAQLEALMTPVHDHFGGELNAFVHSVAFANREDLDRPFFETSRDGFKMALEVSAYSLPASVRALMPALKKAQGSVITLSYLGAEKVVPNYNVMGVAKAALEASTRYLAYDVGAFGVRVNAISAGPIRTLAASGVKDFKSILGKIEEKSPLKRNVDIHQVGATAAFLASDASAGITGQVLYVDSGYQIMAG